MKEKERQDSTTFELNSDQITNSSLSSEAEEDDEEYNFDISPYLKKRPKSI